MAEDRELEVKFYVTDLPALEQRLKELGAALEAGRVHEVNLRFDLALGELGRSGQVLRLRQDARARMTYKGPSQSEGGARLRQEIEFGVDDFEAARRLLEALGYQVSLMYEKYRTTYTLEGVEAVLDELPYGDFIELEGMKAVRIRAAADRLGLDWTARAPESYTSIFDRLKQRLSLNFRDLSFENFKGRTISAEEMGLRPAD